MLKKVFGTIIKSVFTTTKEFCLLNIFVTSFYFDKMTYDERTLLCV